MSSLVPDCKVPVTARNCKPGIQVFRNKDWEWGTEDHKDGHPGYGFLKECFEFEWANVQWNGGVFSRARIGSSGKHDLCVVSRKTEEIVSGL